MSENTRPLRDYFQSLPNGSPTYLVGSDLTRIATSGLAGGIVDSIVAGDGVDVNSSAPSAPVVSLSTQSLDNLLLASTALQPGTVSIADIVSTGTPSITTYLRGDGTWSTPAGGGGGQVDSVIPGAGIDVSDTDPINPVVGLDASSIASLALADTAAQSADLSVVATSGEYNDLLGRPTLGSAAAAAVSDFATAAQGVLAGTALQPDAIGVSIQAYDANTAKLNADQLWTAPQRGGETALSVSGGAIAWDAASGNDFSVTLTANATLSFPTNATTHTGQKGRILITQDGTGSRTFATNVNIKPLGSATTPSIPTAAGSQAYFAYEIINSTLVVYSLAGIGA